MQFSVTINGSSSEEIALFLRDNATAFNPPFDRSVDIVSYAQKLFDYAVRFELRNEGRIVALLASYINTEGCMAYVPYVCVEKIYSGCHFGQRLLEELYRYCQNKGVESIRLEVRQNNVRAVDFYEKQGFESEGVENDKLQMVKML